MLSSISAAPIQPGRRTSRVRTHERITIGCQCTRSLLLPSVLVAAIACEMHDCIPPRVRGQKASHDARGTTRRVPIALIVEEVAAGANLFGYGAHQGAKRIVRQVTKPRRTRVSPPKLGEMQGAFRLPPAFDDACASAAAIRSSGRIGLVARIAEESYRGSSAR